MIVLSAEYEVRVKLPITSNFTLQTSYLPEGLKLGLDEVVVGGLAAVGFGGKDAVLSGL